MPTRKSRFVGRRLLQHRSDLQRQKSKTLPLKAIRELSAQVERDGGAVLGAYNDPFGGKPLLVAALPVALVEPTPYQRDPSDTQSSG